MSDTTEALIVEARNHVDHFPLNEGDALRVGRLADALEAQQARIKAALALHTERITAMSGSTKRTTPTYSHRCYHCGDTWPCATVRALSGGVSDTEQPNQQIRGGSES